MRTLPDRKATGLKQTTHHPLLLTLKIGGATPPLVMLNGKYILSFFGRKLGDGIYMYNTPVTLTC